MFMRNLNLYFFLLLLVSGSFVAAQSYKIPTTLKGSDYVHNKLIFKLKESIRPAASENGVNSPSLQKAIGLIGGGSLSKTFINQKLPRKKFNETGERLADLSLIYELTYAGSMDIYQAAAILQKSGITEWVQPRFTAQPMATPNDPLVSQQYHHAIIKTFEAWDIEDGDTNVVIGITDAGIQFDHQDLQNVKYNYADPIDGSDNDNDGFIDNFRGWNTASNTNDPTATLSPHGMFTTGLSSATVNNAIGIAGTGYKCKFLPIRIDDANGFNFGYEAIVYAADHGCQIINASWGNTYYSPMADEVTRYASINQGALIVAAAGNSGFNEKYYPASYEFVFSVAATGATDLVWNQSTFGSTVDIAAPGELVRSTWPFNGYDISSGTSFSSPIVAGAAALVKSHFPAYTAQQIAERLRVMADTSIYTLSGNAAVRHLLGSGRLNMQRALGASTSPSIHFRNAVFTDNDADNFPEAGDTISVNGELFNFLDPSTNLLATISCTSPFVQIQSASINAGSIGTLQGISNAAAPFRFKLLENAPFNLTLLFKITYADGSYHAFEYLEVRVNPDYMDLAVNNISTTITSRGSIGYNANYAGDGQGFRFKNSNSLLYSSGFMIGSSATLVADNMYGAILPAYDNDFSRVQVVKEILPALNGDKEIVSAFSTDSASSQTLVISQHSYAAAGVDSNFVILEFTVKNNGTQTVAGLNAGLFSDWDINNSVTNNAAYDATRKMSYAFDAPSGGIYAGTKLLSAGTAHSYCFTSDGSAGSLGLYDGYTEVEKFNTLSGAATRNSATNADVANLIAAPSFTLAAGDSITLSFAMLAGNTLAQLETAAARAQLTWQINNLGLQLLTSNESCVQNDGVIEFQSENSTGLSVELYNSDMVLLNTSSDLNSGYSYSGLPAGNYSLLFQFADNSEFSVPFNVEPSSPVELTAAANFETVILTSATVDFTATAAGAEFYSWDFGDGSTSDEQNPSHTFLTADTFTVTSIAYNASCADTSTITIFVETTVGLRTHSASSPRVYPNPSSGQIFIFAPEGNSIKGIRIFDTAGRLIKSVLQNSTNVSIDLNDLSNGTYILEIIGADKVYKERVVINK